MSSEEMITQQTGPNQVVHTRQDSTQELDNLFKSALQNLDGGQQSSWHNRKMPDSFYKPTTHHSHSRVGSHSRDNSMDGSQQGDQVAGPPGFQNHVRQKSCPAEMMSHGNPNRRAPPNHTRTGSLDMILDERANLEHIPLPAGWEAAFTPDGKRYFIE